MICLLVAYSCCIVGISQQAAAVDSMKKALGFAKSTEEKINITEVLARTLMSVNPQQADEYGKQLIAMAEETRDRKLMVKAYMSNGIRCAYLAGVGDYNMRALDYFNKALAIARENKMDDQAGALYLRMANLYLLIPDKDKALSFANNAFAIISSLKNDSLLVVANNTYGNVYLVRNEKILALRNYFTALRLAEDTKNPALLRTCYQSLSSFYASLEDYDKAIDYAVQALRKLDQMHDQSVPYTKTIDINNIGKLYAAKKNTDMAISYFRRSVAMADSLKFSTLKAPAYTSLLNQYLRMDQPQRALDYFNSDEGAELKSYLKAMGLSAAIDQAYAVIYTNLQKFDSAQYYFSRAAGYFESSSNSTMQMSYYAQLGTLYDKTGQYNKAIELYLKVKDIADKTGQLESAESAAKHLDSLYNKSGNFQQAAFYNGIYYKYKDSVETLNKEKELTQVEVADEQYRQQKRDEEEADKKRRRNNIQYMGITIGITGLFVMMVVLGMFKVSARSIKLIGFFAFLMFFEFIFLLFKKNIASLTHGEPLKDLAFMIALAAILVPLHHWLEHRVIKYLTSHNRLTASGKSLMTKVFTARKNEERTKV